MERAAAPNFGHGDPMVGRWLRSRFGGDDEQRDPRRPLTRDPVGGPLEVAPRLTGRVRLNGATSSSISPS